MIIVATLEDASKYSYVLRRLMADGRWELYFAGDELPVSTVPGSAPPADYGTGGGVNVTYTLPDAYGVSVKDARFGAVGDGVANDTAAIRAALLYLKNGGGTLLFPRGTYLTDPIDLRGYSNITLSGDNPSSEHPYIPVSTIKFRSAGAVGIQLSDVTSNTIPAGSAQGIVVKNLFLHGNNLVNACINANKSVVIETCAVRYAAQDGIVLEAMCYPVKLEHVISNSNGRYGIYAKAPYSTAFTLRNVECGLNASHGLVIEGGSACVFDSVLCQSNGGDGIFINRRDPSEFAYPVYLDRLVFLNCYTEANGGWGIRVNSYNNNPAQFAGKINDLTFIGCSFNSSNGQHSQVRGCSRVWTANSSYLTVDPLYNTVALDAVEIHGGVKLNGGQIAFPATQNPSALPNVLDDYREGTFTPAVVGSTSAGSGVYTIQVGRYTKIGNSIRFDVTIEYSSHTGTGTLQIAGLPYAHGPVGGCISTVYAGGLTVPSGQVPIARIASGAQTIDLYSMSTNGVASANPLAMDPAATIIISGEYRI